MTQPASENAGQTDTTTDGVIPPGAVSYEHDEESGEPTFEIARLAAFLDTSFPEEMTRSNRQVPESPVDVAIRLLQALSASAPPHVLERCGEEYCNQPQGHRGEHGVVHSG